MLFTTSLTTSRKALLNFENSFDQVGYDYSNNIPFDFASQGLLIGAKSKGILLVQSNAA